jgi:hypothetical protein
VWPRRCKLRDLGVLGLGQDLREHLVDAELGRDRVGDLPGVAGDHRDLDAERVQRLDGLPGLLAHLVGERERADDLAVAQRVQHGRATPLECLDALAQLGWHLAAVLAQQRRTADRDGRAVDVRLHPAAGDRAEPGRGGQLDAPLARRGHDRPPQRVLAVALDRRRDREQRAVVTVDGGQVGDRVLALRQRAGLVEQHDVDRAHPLQRQAVLDEDAPARGARRGDRDHERDREAERVGAGDHEHRDGPRRRGVRAAEQRPGHERRDRGGERDVEQQRRGPVRASAWARDREPCASATSRWMPASAVSSPTADTSARIAESVATVPATTRSPSPLGHRARLAGDHRLVELRGALHDPAVRRHAPAGPDQDHVTDLEVADHDAVGLAVRDPLGLVWQQLGERRERARAWPIARISIQCPSSMITISAASSHQNSSSNQPSVVAALARNATVIAMPINSIIPGRRSAASSTAPARNGQPP